MIFVERHNAKWQLAYCGLDFVSGHTAMDERRRNLNQIDGGYYGNRQQNFAAATVA